MKITFIIIGNQDSNETRESIESIEKQETEEEIEKKILVYVPGGQIQELIEKVISKDNKKSEEYVVVANAGSIWAQGALQTFLVAKSNLKKYDLFLFGDNIAEIYPDYRVASIYNDMNTICDDFGMLFFEKKYLYLLEKMLITKTIQECMLIIYTLLYNSNDYVLLNSKYYKRKCLRRATDKKWYKYDIIEWINKIRNVAKENYDEHEQYSDYVIMQELNDCMQEELESVLLPDEISEFKRMLAQFLKEVDDFAILKSKGMMAILKRYAIELKYGLNIYSKLKWRAGFAMFNNMIITNLVNQKMFVPSKLYWKGGKFFLRTIVSNPINGDGFSYYILDSYNHKFEMKYISSNVRRKCLGEVILEEKYYDAKIPLKLVLSSNEITYHCVVDCSLDIPTNSREVLWSWVKGKIIDKFK